MLSLLPMPLTRIHCRHPGFNQRCMIHEGLLFAFGTPAPAKYLYQNFHQGFVFSGSLVSAVTVQNSSLNGRFVNSIVTICT